jgi:transposase
VIYHPRFQQIAFVDTDTGELRECRLAHREEGEQFYRELKQQKASRRRQDLLDLLDQLTPKIQELTRALEEEVETRPVTRRLMTHPGVGPLTALAYELVIGTPERFHCGKQLASYVGLVPEEKSSGDRRQLGHISKQGNVLLRFLLVEAAQVTVRSQPEWRSKFFHLAMRRGRNPLYRCQDDSLRRRPAIHFTRRADIDTDGHWGRHRSASSTAISQVPDVPVMSRS